MSNPERRRAIWSASVGHTLEWYDFGVYAFVATNIAKQIFPSTSEAASLLATFAAFGVGFLSRPLGGIVLGWFGDRYGSKKALILSFSLMGVATLMLGLVPTYEAIGWVAPAIVVLCRLLQGLSGGGEYAASATYLVAWAPDGRRGLFGSFQQMGSAIGALLGSAMGLGLSAYLGPDAMMEWGWRVPFIAGGLVLVVGLHLRRHAKAAPEVDVSIPNSPTTSPARANFLRALRLFLFGGTWAVPFYLILFYMPTFIQKVLHIEQRSALLISSIGLVVYTLLIPVAGRISDTLGRRTTIVIGGVGVAVAAMLVFPAMVESPTFQVILISQLCLNVFLVMISGPAPTTIVEMFPPRRLAWMNGAYAIALAIFGGFAPTAVTWIINTTGSTTSPMYLLAAASIGCALVMFFSRETAFTKSVLRQPPAVSPIGVAERSPGLDIKRDGSLQGS
ncbi:MFS transporter [soil metagenome]